MTIRGLASDARARATWSRHNSIKSCLHRVRIIRNFEDEDGDGLREFS